MPEIARGRFPDFIIGGAPKCATSTLHAILEKHPDIGIPQGELFFFDSDDPIVHPKFFSISDDKIEYFDCDDNNGEYLIHYIEKFREYMDRKIIGEDSTTYLFSEVSSNRIKKFAPETKMIFLLRDPVDRAYSQYWHNVSSGRTGISFEKSIIENPSILLGSSYLPGIKRFINDIGKDQVKLLLFSELVNESQRITDATTDFLGVSRMTVPPASWSNRTTYPKSLALTLVLNRLGGAIAGRRYRNHLGSKPLMSHRIQAGLERRWRNHVVAATLNSEQKPPMKAETRLFLQKHLSMRNRGLSDVIERDLSQIWEGFDG